MALKEPFLDFGEQWTRMLYGGAVFNAGMIAQDAWNTGEFLGGYGEDYDGWDLLTNLLIGAYTQRGDNASKWDMNTDINRIREGITILGGDANWTNTNFYLDENFPTIKSRFDKSTSTEMNLWLVEEGYASNDPIVGKEFPLEVSAGQKSVDLAMRAEQEDFGILQSIVQDMKSDFTYSKTLQSLSVNDANKILKKYEETHGIGKNDFDKLSELKESSALKSTENLEDGMLNIIKRILNQGDVEGNEDLKGFFTTTDDNKPVTPETILLSNKLKQRIKNGEFEELLGSGSEGLKEFERLKMSLQSIIKTLKSTEEIQTSSTAKVFTIENESSFLL